MEIIQKAFDCGNCKMLLEEPVALACGATVCLKHLENLANKTFFCESCQQHHIIERDLIKVNKIIQMLINANLKSIDLGGEYSRALDSCNTLNQIVHDLEIIAKDPNCFIDATIDKLKIKTDLIRQEYKSMIDEKANKIILELDKYEKDCKINMDSMDFKKKMATTNENLCQIRAQLVESNTKMNDFGTKKDQWCKIEKENRTSSCKFMTESVDFQNELLLNKLDIYITTFKDFKKITLQSYIK